MTRGLHIFSLSYVYLISTHIIIIFLLGHFLGWSFSSMYHFFFMHDKKSNAFIFDIYAKYHSIEVRLCLPVFHHNINLFNAFEFHLKFYIPLWLFQELYDFVLFQELYNFVFELWFNFDHTLFTSIEILIFLCCQENPNQ